MNNIILREPTFSTYNDICSFDVENVNITKFPLNALDFLGVITESYNVIFNVEYSLDLNTVRLLCYLSNQDTDKCYEAELTNDEYESLLNIAQNTLSIAVNSVVA